MNRIVLLRGNKPASWAQHAMVVIDTMQSTLRSPMPRHSSVASTRRRRSRYQFSLTIIAGAGGGTMTGDFDYDAVTNLESDVSITIAGNAFGSGSSLDLVYTQVAPIAPPATSLFQHRLRHHRREERRRRGVPGLYRPADPRRRRGPALRRAQCEPYRVSAVIRRRPGRVRHPRDDDAGAGQPRGSGRRSHRACREAASVPRRRTRTLHRSSREMPPLTDELTGMSGKPLKGLYTDRYLVSSTQ